MGSNDLGLNESWVPWTFLNNCLLKEPVWTVTENIPENFKWQFSWLERLETMASTTLRYILAWITWKQIPFWLPNNCFLCLDFVVFDRQDQPIFEMPKWLLPGPDTSRFWGYGTLCWHGVYSQRTRHYGWVSVTHHLHPLFCRIRNDRRLQEATKGPLHKRYVSTAYWPWLPTSTPLETC